MNAPSRSTFSRDFDVSWWVNADAMLAIDTPMSLEQVDQFLSWMRYFQKQNKFPESLAKSSVAFREWFCAFMRDEKRVGNQPGKAWVASWTEAMGDD